MIETAIKFSLLAAVAWAVTRGVRPANAAAARMVWLLTLLSPAFVPLLTPALFANVRATSMHVAAPALVISDWMVPAVYLTYVAGVAILSARLSLGWRRVARLVREARPLRDAELARLRGCAGSPALRILESDLDGAVTAGAIRPVVILPRTWRRASDVALTAMLRHEAAHVHRRDPAALLFARLVEAVLWPTPAAWLARREFVRFAESAADASAASAMEPADYASALLCFAARRRLVVGPLLGASGGESAIARRIRLLLDDEEFGAQPAARIRAGLVAFIVAVVIVAAVRVGMSTPADTGGLLGGPHDYAARHAARHSGH